MPETDRSQVFASVQEHLARYFDAVDRGDLDEVMAILDGATLTAGGTSTSDPAAIRGLYEARATAPSADGRRATKHHAGNLVLAGPGPDGGWRASVYYLRLEPGPAGPVVATSGRIEEDLLPDGDRWRVVRHSIVSDF